MSEIKNGRFIGLYGADHLQCNYMMTLGFKGLKCSGIRWLHLKLFSAVQV